MRIALVAILLFCSILLSAQDADIQVTYETENEMTLEEIFHDLEDQYGIRFSYATSSWKDTPIRANFQDQSLEDVLDYLLEEQDLEYKILSNNILVRKSDTYSAANGKAYNKSIHIKGRVVSKSKNQEALDYATISILHTPIGTYSDVDGSFDLEIPEEYLDKNIVVSYVGFESTSYTISELKDEFLLVPLSEDGFAFEEIKIVNRKKPLSIGGLNNAVVLNKIQIANGTSGVIGNDINRTIQMLPGISAHDDDSAEIKIRGSNGDETLMVLDGMPIYNANHYYGIFSGVNTAFIDSVNIFKNTYPIHYGGKTGGLVELFSDQEIPTKKTGEFSVDLLTASAKVKSPITSNSFIEIAGRSTIKNVSNNQFNTLKNNPTNNFQVQNFSEPVKNKRYDPSFRFYDLNAKYIWESKAKNRISLNFYRSDDQLENEFTHKINNSIQDEVELQIVENQIWNTTASSLGWTHVMNPALTVHTNAHYTQYNNKNWNEIKVNKKFKNGNSSSMDIENSVDLGAIRDNELTDVGLTSYANISKKNHTLKLGFLTSHQHVEYSFIENNEPLFSDDLTIQSLAGFSSYRYQFKDRLTLEAGLRATYYNHLDNTFYSPRILANYTVNDHISLKSSYSVYQQVIRQLYFEYRTVPMDLWVAAGKNEIPVLNSQNMMVGGTVRVGIFKLDVELYKKELKGVLEYAILNPTDSQNNPQAARDYVLFKGDGSVQGIDFILSSGYKGYDTYLSYTLSKNEERFKAIFNNKYYASENDRRHQFKWVNTYYTGSWNFGLNSIFSSGRPYSDLTNRDKDGNILESDPENRFKRLPSYFRLDLSVGYQLKVKNTPIQFQFSVFNVLNNQNVKYIQSINTELRENQLPLNTVIGNESSLLNRTMNAGVKIEF